MSFHFQAFLDGQKIYKTVILNAYRIFSKMKFEMKSFKEIIREFCSSLSIGDNFDMKTS